MKKSDAWVVIGIFLLLALALVINNSHWFVPDRFAGERQREDRDSVAANEERDDAVEIMENAEGDRNDFTVPEGKYYFGLESGGVMDITSNADNMQIDGKVLNKGCCLENYMPIRDGDEEASFPIEIKGEGTVTFRSIEGKYLELEEEEGKIPIKNSGYYLRAAIAGSSEGEMTFYCQVNDAEQELPRLQIIETSTRELVDEFQWETGEENYTCKLENDESIFVDLGKETEEKRNILFVMP